MSSPETVSNSTAERDRGVPDRARSLLEPVAPELARQAESGNLSAASGVVSLVRAGRTFLKGNRKRGALQALGGLFWVGVAVAQRRSGGSRTPVEPRGRASDDAFGGFRSGDDLTEVVDTSPDVDDAVEPGERETDHATGEEVVDTTDADVERTETTGEVGVSSDIEDEVDDAEVDQRDVAGSGDITASDEAADRDEEHEFSESGDAEQAETDEDAEVGDDANAEASEDVNANDSDDAETEVGESEEAALVESEESETSE